MATSNMSMIEIGQMLFGTKTGTFVTEEWQDALIEALLSEIDRVYWNVNQKEWDRINDPEIKGLQFNAYYWGESEEVGARPNFKFDMSPQEIRWYKYPGRGQTCTVDMKPEEWIDWFNKGLKIIRKKEKGGEYM